MNLLALLVAAFVPMLIGMFWYSHLCFGNAWMKEINETKETLQAGMGKGKMIRVFAWSYLFSLMLASMVQMLVVHQFSVLSLLGGDFGTASEQGKAFLVGYEHHFRTFKHGVFHGVLTGIFFILPVIAMNAFFEKKSWRYIFIHVGYWILCLALMGGILCAWESAQGVFVSHS